MNLVIILLELILNLQNSNNNQEILNKTQENILKLIRENKRITQDEMSSKLKIHITTIARNLAYLKKANFIKRIGSNKNGQWELL